ncbi:MAG: alanine racemase [Ruminococcus sp.]|nr:alanine racemase [Ruminococcus sp.]
MQEYMRVRADVDLDAIHHNLSLAKSVINKDTQLMAVIKADGYGHGANQIAKYCDDVIDRYAVAIPEEGIDLRKAGFTKPINLLGYTHPTQYEDVINYDLIPAIFTLDMAKTLSQKALSMNKTVKIHIKLDTGMSRIGFADNEKSVDVIKEISLLPNLEVDGIFSHFARADEKDKSVARSQFERFTNFVNKLKSEGLKIPNCHISNSAAIMELSDMNLQIVRSGIITYGLYPSEEMDKENFKIIPAMELKSQVSFVKTLKAGTPVGYGGTYVTDKETVIATIPVGYADGYPRSLSNKGRVIIKGQSAPIVGRVCMDQFMVDVTCIEGVKQGDEVTLMGKEGEEFISCEELSGLAGSFNYEFVCNISKRVPRVYYKDGKIVDVVTYV